MSFSNDEMSNFAKNVLSKGKDYLANSLVDLYQQNDSSASLKLFNSNHSFQVITNNNQNIPINTNLPPVITTSFKVHVFLETPVISVPVNSDAEKFLVAHLGQISIRNEPVEAASSTSSTNLKVSLKKMNLFFVDKGAEQDYLVRQKQKQKQQQPAAKSPPIGQNDFLDIFYTPNQHQTVIEKTDLHVSLIYTPANRLMSEAACVSLSTAITNTCRINLSKQGIEQMLQTFDNFVYKTQPVATITQVKSNSETTPTQQANSSISELITSTPNKKPSIPSFGSSNINNNSSHTNNHSYYQDGNILWTFFEHGDYFRFSNLLDSWQTNVDVAFEMRLRFERLDILFLADVEKPLQDLAELTFNQYELSISKRSAAFTNIRMSLKSIYLVDKLFDGDEKTSTGSANTGVPKSSSGYLLWTTSNQQHGNVRRHTCNNQAFLRANRVNSVSMPDLSSASAASGGGGRSGGGGGGKRQRKRISKPPKTASRRMPMAYLLSNKSYLSELGSQLSTSLPSELAHVCRETNRHSLENGIFFYFSVIFLFIFKLTFQISKNKEDF